MVRNRMMSRWSKAALIVGLAVAGCGKGGGGGGGAGGGAGAAGGGDDINMLPADSDIVVGLNFAQVVKSPLWGQFVQPLIMKGDNAKKLEEFKTKCGFDPLATMQSFVMGAKVGASGEPDGVVVIHGFDKAKATACLETMKPDMEKEGTTFTNANGVFNIKDKSGKSTFLTWTNDTTVVAVVGPAASEASLKTATEAKSGLKTSAQFTAMYDKISKSDSLWGLANGNAPFFEKMGSMGFKPKAMYGSLNVTDGLALDLRMKLDSADQASSLSGLIKGQADQAKAFVDKLDVSNDKEELKINVAMSAAKLEAIKGQMGGMLGGM